MNGSIANRQKFNSQQVDRQLNSKVIQALNESGYLPLRKISVTALEGHVALRGRVPTYYLKQLAQCAAMSVRGVESLQNDVDVV